MTWQPLRFSHLKHMAQSPAHYLASLTSGFDSAAMRLGRLVHLRVFENGEAICFHGRRQGKVWEAFQAEHPDDEIFSLAESNTAWNMLGALRSNRDAMSLLWRDGARVEHTIEWSIAGRPCRGTPDIFDADYIADLKTCATADPRRWTGRYGEIRKRAYHAQLAWYLDGLDASGARELKPRRAYLVAVESKPPHAVTVFELDESEIEAGRAAYRSWFEQLRVCEESDHFPAYTQSPVRVVADQDDEAPALVWGDEDETEEAA